MDNGQHDSVKTELKSVEFQVTAVHYNADGKVIGESALRAVVFAASVGELPELIDKYVRLSNETGLPLEQAAARADPSAVAAT